SGSPTITILVSPQPAFTSTSMGYASMPLTAAEQTLDNIRKLCGSSERSSIRFFGPLSTGPVVESPPLRLRTTGCHRSCVAIICVGNKLRDGWRDGRERQKIEDGG